GPHDAQNVELSRTIAGVEAVCLHVRRLHGVPNTENAKPLAAVSSWHHLDPSYYQRAVDTVSQRVPNPHFFVFADFADPDWVKQYVRTPHPIEFVTHNGADK